LADTRPLGLAESFSVPDKPVLNLLIWRYCNVWNERTGWKFCSKSDTELVPEFPVRRLWRRAGTV